jgi:hypothetical protein
MRNLYDCRWIADSGWRDRLMAVFGRDDGGRIYEVPPEERMFRVSAVSGQGKSPLNLAMLSKVCERIAAGDTVEIADPKV